MKVGLLVAAFGLGAALGLLPGPVQLVLLTEPTRGGAKRGFWAMAGANGTLGTLLLLLAMGLGTDPPTGTMLRILKVAGGGFLLVLAADGVRLAIGHREQETKYSARGRTPFLKGLLSVILNPGLWLFLATTASAVLTTAERSGGRLLSVEAAVALTLGVVTVDGTVVLIGQGARRFETGVGPLFTGAVAVGLGIFGLLLLVQGLIG